MEFRIRYPYKSEAWVLREAGYKPYVARQPHKVFGSLTVQAELAQRGFLAFLRPKKEMQNVVEPDQNAHQIAPQPIPFDPAKLTTQQLACLGQMLDTLPEPTPQNMAQEEETKRPYDPADGGLDPNTGEAPERYGALNDLSSRMSSM